MAKRTYKFRLYPSKKQIIVLNEMLETCRNTYNKQLENKIIWYQDKGQNLSYPDLNAMLLDLRIIYPKMRKIHSQVLQDINNRITKAFDNFFRRVMQGEKAGFPRFKGKNRYDSITYPQSGYKFTSQKRLKVSKIGELPIRLHRAIKGTIKTMNIHKTLSGKWFACFSCDDVPIHIDTPPNKAIGLDVGLDSFLTDSNGNKVDNPRFLINSEKLLKLRCRQHSKKNKGSTNREKSRLRLARLYEKVANQRSDFLHKLSLSISKSYSFIAVEDLNIKNMVKNHYLAKSINDVSWNKFIKYLTYKAENAGGKVCFVPAKNTSVKCSSCGAMVYKSLSVRTHKCSHCGFVIDRDHNSALNILYSSPEIPKELRESTPVEMMGCHRLLKQESLCVS